MKLRILAVGRVKDKWLREGIDEYRKRLSRFTELEISEVADSPDNHDPRRALTDEGTRLLDRIRPQDFCVVLDLAGKACDSPRLAVQLQDWLDRHGGRVTFIICGSNGCDRRILERADARLCLSSLTFPHQLTRLILLEQLYRAFKINANETYHK